MLDKYLPDYFLALTTLTDPHGNSRSSTLPALTSSKIWRSRAPESTAYPYIVVADGEDIDFGQTADQNLRREVGSYNIIIVGRTFNSIDQIYRDVVDAIKMCKNRYIPTAIASSKLWVQCIILKDCEQFNGKPIDGGQEDVLGYNLLIKAGYDV